MVAKLIKIKTNYGKLVYGRVYIYDEQSKTLILKVIDSQIYTEQKEEVVTGMAVYNVGNVTYVGEEEDARDLTEEKIIDYQAGHIDCASEHYQEAYKAFAKTDAEVKKK